MTHPLHSICPYFAMFPPDFVERHVLAFSDPGDIVFDPFSGRGTTVFESLLLSRQGFGLDINPVAACISGAKADPPAKQNVLNRIQELKLSFQRGTNAAIPDSDFFRCCFARKTLEQICFLRETLKWKTRKVDRFISAMILGILHGESHKTLNCLSNRMPRTISTKPDYSVRWWAANGYVAPERDTFRILESQVAFRYAKDLPRQSGDVRLGDVRHASRHFPGLRGQVRLVITSPPYLDTTDYAEDQWLRLWFLGGKERPRGNIYRDSRHSSVDSYWKFLTDSWRGIASLLKPKATIVIRIGGKALSREQVEVGVRQSLRDGLGQPRLNLLQPLASSEIRNRQTNVFRPGTTGRRMEYDFIFRIT